jgi:hypothetical protein
MPPGIFHQQAALMHFSDKLLRRRSLTTMNGDSQKNRWILRLLVAQGFLCMGVGVALAISTAVFVYGAIETQGRIVGYNRPSTGKPTWSCEAVFSYTDGEGTVHTKRSTGFDYSPPSAIGSSVPVLYVPGSPGRAEIRSVGRMCVVPLIFMFGGTIPIGMACVFRWLFSRQGLSRAPS